MKKRGLVFVVIMSIITFGIYQLYWLISTREELVAKGNKVPSAWRAIIYPLLLMLSMVVVLVVVYSMANTALEQSVDTGGVSLVLNFLTILLGFGGLILAVILWVRLLSGYSKAVEKVTNGTLSSSFVFWIGILAFFISAGVIWIALVQYHYNHLNTDTAGPAPTPQELPPQNTVPNPPVANA